MRKFRFVFLMIFLCISCNTKSSLSKIDKKSQSVFVENLNVVEKFLEDQYIEEYQRLEESIDFLQNLTNIESKTKYQMEKFYTPTGKNLKDWKNWYNENKTRLYWDKNEQKVKLKE